MFNRKRAPDFPGQHLLSSKHLAKRLVGLAGDLRAYTTIDIGAGAGALTVPLAAQGGCVLAVESDPLLAGRLQQRLQGKDNVLVLQQDFLRTPLPRRPFKVVASIPFSITTAILGKLMDRPSAAFCGGIVVVEAGAALRFTGSPVTDLRILGWRTWFDLQVVRRIASSAFSPPPRVDAAVLRIDRKDPSPVPYGDYARYTGMVAGCLQDPQRPLAGALGGIFTAEQIRRLLRRLHVDRDRPACTLTPADWTVVYETMCRYAPRVPGIRLSHDRVYPEREPR